MNISDLIEEVYDSGSKAYPAYSQSPRKDFVPYSTKDGYNFPYQKNAPPIFPPTTPQPPNTESLPWPLQTINDDLSDSFIYLLGAAKKLTDAVKINPSLSEKQKEELILMYKALKIALDQIKKVGMKISSLTNMALPLPPQTNVTPTPIKSEHPFI